DAGGRPASPRASAIHGLRDRGGAGLSRRGEHARYGPTPPANTNAPSIMIGELASYPLEPRRGLRAETKASFNGAVGFTSSAHGFHGGRRVQADRGARVGAIGAARHGGGGRRSAQGGPAA